MGELIVISGPPGAGKSTVARRLASRYRPSALVTGDSFFGFLHRGAIAPWLAGSEPQNRAVIEAAAAAAGRLSDHCDVVYDGVAGPWFLSTFLGASGRDSLHYFVLLPPVETCLERITSRVGHGFSDTDAARRMHAEFASSADVSRYAITTGPETAGAMAVLLAERVAARSHAVEAPA